MSPLPLKEFAEKLNEIMPQLAREFASRTANELYKGKITVPQFMIMEYLEKHDQAKMTDLARMLKVTTAAMTGFIERMVRDGFCVRGYDEHDRRIVLIRDTPKAKELVRNIEKQRKKMIMDIFSRISENERRDYLNILTHVYDILKKTES